MQEVLTKNVFTKSDAEEILFWIDKKEFLKAYALLHPWIIEKQEHPLIYAMLSRILFALGKYEEALFYIKKSLVMNPLDKANIENHVLILTAQKKFQEALSVYQSHSDLKTFGRAVLSLRMGLFREGLDYFEQRKSRCQLVEEMKKKSIQEWNGEDLQGKTVLVISEQGLGDTLQWMNYLPLLASLKCRVVFIPLKPLEKFCYHHQQELCVFRIENAQSWSRSSYDVYIPLMSLSKFLDPEFKLTHYLPFLKGNKSEIIEKVTCFKRVFRKQVAVAWKGNPNHINDDVRSIPFLAFKTLFEENPDVLFYVFNFSWTSQEREIMSSYVNIIDCSAFVSDYYETASLLEICDSCISCDTSLVHLAGRVGLLTYVLCSLRCDWRWEAPLSVYPTVFPMIQTKIDDWKSLLNQASLTLKSS